MAIIAIAEKLGCRAIDLGQLTAAELNYRFLSSNDLIPEASRCYNVTPEQLRVADERQPHFWQRLLTDSERVFSSYRAVALKTMARDNVVVVGRSVAMLLPFEIPHGLRVRTVGQFSARVSQAALEEGTDVATAEKRVRDYDRELRARMQTLTGADIDDPSNYHIAVNTLASPLKLLAATLAAFVAGRETLPAAYAMLHDAAIAAQVRAAMLAHPKVGSAQIEVQCASGVVRLTGAGLVPPWDEMVRRIASQVEGVASVQVSPGDLPIAPPPA